MNELKLFLQAARRQLCADTKHLTNLVTKHEEDIENYLYMKVRFSETSNLMKLVQQKILELETDCIWKDENER